jgi:formylglycine-generating enzyme required for sulfatase activity/predicted Ser/Thr protein kinase
VTVAEGARLRVLFEAALEVAPDERAAFVSERCGSDLRLRAELEELLRCHLAASGFLGAPPVRLDSSVVVSGCARDALRPGELVGPYCVVRLLGEGGMGEVYLCEQAAPLRRKVALKVLKLGMDSKEILNRFQLESQALALMEHQSIARIFGSGLTADGRSYFAMEHVDGLPLHVHCDAERLSVRARLQLFLEVCDAVQHAHQKGILHRDLKPSNVLVARAGDRSVPKVIDFGVAKAMEPGLAGRTLVTLDGTMVGTPEYMSPEQAGASGRDVDTRSDIYSLGVVLFELLSGALPHASEHLRGKSLTEVQRKLMVGAPPLAAGQADSAAERRATDASGLRRELHGDLRWIVARALEVEPERRYASVSELAADLRRYLGGQPVLAGPPTAGYRLGRMLRRNWRPVLALGGVLLALSIGWWRASAGWKVAEEREGHVLRFSDGARIEQLTGEVISLGPARPESVPAMLEWEARVEEVRQRMPLHEQFLAQLEAAAVRELSSDGTFRLRFASFEETWLHASALEIVSALEDLSSSDPGRSAHAAVQRRRRFAEEVVRLTLIEPAAAWAEAAAAIGADPRFEGLALAPQLGLVPLGPDPHSGLWEFAHLQSGSAPERGPDGKLTVTEETGIVLVLLPGCSFQMGARLDGSPEARLHDEMIRPDELPVHGVELAPFFLSKYEVTQGQWMRLAHRNPSRFLPGTPPAFDDQSPFTLLHPVERLIWPETCDVLFTADLKLPTEAQWEYAARAGTTSVWWWGNEKAPAVRAANFSDEAWRRVPGRRGLTEEGLWDGYVHTSPVGAFEGNAFGLHDVLGNVWEWTVDQYGSYELPTRPGDGARLGATGTDRIVRGGSWDADLTSSRPLRRCDFEPTFTGSVGVRPARDIRP